MGYWIWTNEDGDILWPIECKCSDCEFHMGYTPREDFRKYFKFCPYCGKSKEGGVIPLSKINKEKEDESNKM